MDNDNMRSDTDLMIAVSGGEIDAFEEIIKRHQNGIYSYFLRLCGDSQTAEDYAQETFLKIYQNATGYKVKAKFTTYMYTIARNCWIDHVRKNNRRGTVLHFDEALTGSASEVPAPEMEIEKNELNQAVAEAVSSLPEKQREVLVLAEVEGMKYDDIAETMGIPLGTVKSRMFNAIKTLREMLQKAGFTEPPKG